MSRSWLIMRMLLVLLFFIIISVIWITCLRSFITFEYIQEKASLFYAFVQNHYFQSVALFIGIYILIGVLALPLASLMTLVGGFLFGTLFGTLYTNIGATLGGFIFFLLVRHIFGFYFQKRFAATLINFNKKIAQEGWFYLLTVRCIPFIPFFMVNALIGLTKIPNTTFLWTTSLGILPISLFYSYAGKQLTMIHSLYDIFSMRIIVIWLILLAMVFLPLVYKKLVKKNLN
jgi:uncharacterized membrane protein YdjX (TVP38/TMEM64 family)